MYFDCEPAKASLLQNDSWLIDVTSIWLQLTSCYKMSFCSREIQLHWKVRPLQKENLGDHNKLTSMGALFCQKKPWKFRSMANMGFRSCSGNSNRDLFVLNCSMSWPAEALQIVCQDATPKGCWSRSAKPRTLPMACSTSVEFPRSSVKSMALATVFRSIMIYLSLPQKKTIPCKPPLFARS